MKRITLIRSVWITMLSLCTTMLLACGGGAGGGGTNPPAGENSVVTAIRNIAPVNACPAGGITVEAGIDDNGNSVLDPAEVDSTQYVCNGETGTAGTNSLVSVTAEPASENCANGGSRVLSGIDANVNGILDATEASYSSYVCSGPPAPAVPAAPMDVQAAGGDAQVTIRWTAASGAYAYNIYWNTMGSVSTSDNVILNATMPYVHAGRTNNATYYYRIAAINSAGEGALSAEVSAQPRQPFSQMMQKVLAGDIQTNDWFGYSVSISGDYAIVGAHYEDGGTGNPMLNAGAAYIFHRTGANTWDAGTKLTVPDSQAFDNFGISVSISGDYAIVGAYGEDGGAGNPLSGAGAAYIFHRTGVNTWDAGTKVMAPDAQPDDKFGISVSISGDYAIVGAFYEDGGAGDPMVEAGAAYIFHRTGENTWDSGTRIIASDAQTTDFFGVSVSISGDYAIVGAYWEDGGAGDPLTDAGAAYIFHRTGANMWDAGIKIMAPDAQAGDLLGWSVSISGDYAIVGASYEDGGTGNPMANAGAAYIFHRTGVNTWDAGAKIMAPDAQALDLFGYSVSISGDYAIVGAYYEDGGAGDPMVDAGAAYIFHRIGMNTWDTGTKIVAPDAQADDHFGCSISISGDYAIVGAYWEDGGAGDPLSNSGAAYFY